MVFLLPLSLLTLTMCGFNFEWVLTYCLVLSPLVVSRTQSGCHIQRNTKSDSQIAIKFDNFLNCWNCSKSGFFSRQMSFCFKLFLMFSAQRTSDGATTGDQCRHGRGSVFRDPCCLGPDAGDPVCGPPIIIQTNQRYAMHTGWFVIFWWINEADRTRRVRFPEIPRRFCD